MVDLYSLVALATPEKAAVVEHVFGERVEGPEVALAGVAGLARYFDEAVVQTVEGFFAVKTLNLPLNQRTNLKLCLIEFCQAGNFSL